VRAAAQAVQLGVGVFQPNTPALVQRTSVFSGGWLSFIIFAPATNQTITRLFLNDDFSSNPAFRATMGFSNDARNRYGLPLFATLTCTGSPPPARSR
jgi:hypothetical protein